MLRHSSPDSPAVLVRRLALPCLAIAALLPPPAWAQENVAQATETGTGVGTSAAADSIGSGGSAPDNAELARRIEILSQELEEMRLGEVADTAGASSYGLGPAASKVYGISRGVSIGGYGEMLYENFAAENERGAPGNTPDQIDFLRSVFYIGYKFSDRILVNTELEFEHASTGKRGTVSVEFAYLDFLFDPAVNARAGMLLAPMGLVNELHEPPIFLGARRPDVEQRILPTTWRGNGAGLFGETASGFSYRAYVIEGFRGVANSSAGVRGFTAADGVREARQSGSFSRVEDWGLTGRLDWSGRGLLVGGSVFTGGAAQGDTTASGEEFTGSTVLYEGHARYEGRGLRASALWAAGTIDDAAEFNARNGFTGNQSIGSELSGSYAEVGYDVVPLLSPASSLGLMPFVRWEILDTQAEVPAGYARNVANERTILTLGASFFPDPRVVVKADYQMRENEAESGLDQFNAALGFLF